MSYPVNLGEEDFELFRLARILGKQKVLELLKTVHSKDISIDDLVSTIKAGVKTEETELNKETLSFILGFIASKFPEVEIPPKIRMVIPSVEASRKKIHEAKIGIAERARRGGIMPQADYTLPILEALIEMGGSGKMSDVLDTVFNKIKDRLKQRDFEKLPSGTSVRWKNRAQWERQRLKTGGYLKKDSPFGIWEITEEGRKLYESLRYRQR